MAIYIISITALTSCSSPIQKRATLGDVDVIGIRQAKTSNFVQPESSDDEILKAYANYLKHASKDDRSRVTALNRLAQLEFELSEKLLKNKGNTTTDEIESLDDKLYNAKLDRTIELLNTSIRDYPDAKNNDKTLYQLAKAYDQKSEPDKALVTLKKLVKKYPKSPYFIESQFRLAEDDFSRKKYTSAEDKYTVIIGSKKNVIFYEKAVYKRGWARFKQEFYIEAVDDFMEVINSNHFNEYEKLSDSEKNEFNEYFRAVGLSFSYLGGAKPLAEYLKNNKKFVHRYYLYAHLSDIYLKQERHADAVDTLNAFAQFNQDSVYLPESYLKVINIWKSGGFANKVNQAVALFYDKFNPDGAYWHKQRKVDSRIYKASTTALKEYILTVAANYHKTYQTTKDTDALYKAKRWYGRYLKYYRSQAHKDNIYYLYASLLSSSNDYINAFEQFELAAYDSSTILNKNAAYETVQLASKLHKSTNKDKLKFDPLTKLTTYSKLYAQQYPNDKNTAGLIAHACEAAYMANRHQDVINLSENITDSMQSTYGSYINTIRAHSYFKLKKYKEAEETYLIALEQQKTDNKKKTILLNSLAQTIYYQGKESAAAGNIDSAIEHYTRIASIAPSSEIASTGLYDAIALTMQNEQWPRSIVYIKKFQSLYPSHRYSHDITKKLSVAYLNSKQDIEAARELEKASNQESDKAYKLSALWKAAQLYEAKSDYSSAIRSYEQYSKNFPRPFPQYIEAQHKLVTLHSVQNNERLANVWRRKIIDADRKTPTSLKTDRSKFIASTAALQLARNSHIQFSSIKLNLPLKTSLRKKKTSMQNAVNLYGRASSYGSAETATEATYSIAEIYNSFSKALLESERPRHLKDEELSQYQILLEDQAFPFEEKAIEFHETNLTHVREDIYDEWVQKSHAQLKKLFPVRYNREAQLDMYINVLH